MKKILFVDDEPNVLAALQRQLHRQFTIDTAQGPEAGLAALHNRQDFAVVVADMRMPKMDGVEFLAYVKDTAPDVVRIMLTGNADQNTAIEAVNQGNIFRFLTKPCPPEILAEALNAALRQHDLIVAERELLENTLCASIKVLTEILAIAEPKSFAQAERLRNNVREVSKALKGIQSWPLEAAAMLAQIGLITIPPEVTLKARLGHPLTIREQEMFRQVPNIGANLLSQIPRMEEVSQIILYQNKCFDGSGFPEDRVAGTAIPFGARVLKVLRDLTELEVAGEARSAALEHLRARKGWYDLQILEAIGSPSLAGLERTATAKPTVTVAFAQLRIGQVLRSDVATKDGLLIVVAGNCITPPLMERLKNFAHVSGIKEPISVEA